MAADDGKIEWIVQTYNQSDITTLTFRIKGVTRDNWKKAVINMVNNSAGLHVHKCGVCGRSDTLLAEPLIKGHAHYADNENTVFQSGKSWYMDHCDTFECRDRADVWPTMCWVNAQAAIEIKRGHMDMTEQGKSLTAALPLISRRDRRVLEFLMLVDRDIPAIDRRLFTAEWLGDNYVFTLSASWYRKPTMKENLNLIFISFLDPLSTTTTTKNIRLLHHFSGATKGTEEFNTVQELAMFLKEKTTPPQ